MQRFDLIVIGGGSGGVRAARIAASHGAKVAICEGYRYGGTCVIRGCIPKKLMVYASQFQEEFHDSNSYGWGIASSNFNWHTLIANKDREIDRLNRIYENLLTNVGVTMLFGTGSLIDTNTVRIDETDYHADKILIATGATPFVPDIPGKELAITSNEVFYLPQQPQRVLVVGGGYIAVEFAGIFHGLGSETALSYRSEQILRGFDMDIRNHLSQEINKKGVSVHLNSNVTKITQTSSGEKQVHFDDDSSAVFDCVLYATGRKPNTDALNLHNAGVELGNKNEIIVDRDNQTNIESIFAVGDVTDRIALTPVATMEGHAFADTYFGNNHRQADHDNVPSAVFSQPPVASVGLSEHEAAEQYANLDIYKSEFRILKHTLTNNQERTLIKLIVDSDSDKVIGVHMVGHDAAEIMQGIAIAVKAGARKADFDKTVGIHPSSAEEFCTMRSAAYQYRNRQKINVG